MISRAVHDSARDRGKEHERVVAAPVPELFAHPRRPILGAVLPAVDMRRHQRLAGRGAHVGDELAHHARELGLDALRAQLVALEALAARRSGGVLDSRAGVPETQDGPFPGRHVPREAPVSAHLCREVDDARPVDRHRRRNLRFGRRGHVPAFIKRLGFDVGNAVIALGRRKGQDGDIPVKIAHGLGPRQRRREMRRPREPGLAPDDLLHRLFRSDPGPAAPVPAGVVVHVDLEPEPSRLGDGELEQPPPLVPHERSLANRRALVDLHDQDAADADALHGLEVGRDPLAGDVAVQPEPVDPGPGRVRRLDESRLQRVLFLRGAPRHTERQHDQNDHKPLVHGFPPRSKGPTRCRQYKRNGGHNTNSPFSQANLNNDRGL